MSNEHLVPIPPPNVRVDPAQVQPLEIPPAVGAELPPPSAEQVRAADHTFRHSQESDLVMGVLGMWTGTLLLHDLAIEHFDRPEEETHPRLSTRSEDEDEPTR